MPTSPTAALTFTDVSYAYEPHLPQVLTHVSFEVARGSFVVLVGPSGGGKSTVLRLAAGLEKPLSGTIVNTLRTRMIFQSAGLLPWRSALDNVLIGLTDLPYTDAEKKQRAKHALTELGLGAHLEKMPRALSGGQRQRVGIARALVSEPECLLLDEPFSALDIETATALANAIEQIRVEKGITMLMVSHSIDDAVFLADTVLVCRDGSVHEHIDIPLSRPRMRDDATLRRLAATVHAAIPDASA